MTAWPPEIPDPFDPGRGPFGQTSHLPWGPVAEEPQTINNIEESAEHFRSRFDLLKEELQKYIVGQDEILEHVLTAIVAGGHVLLESAPGLGKTTLARSIANALSLFLQHVQFTPDLLSSDLIGTNLLIGSGSGQDTPHFEFSPGPIFCNLLLGDQINRASPKTQAALLEAMDEKSVTVAGQTRLLAEPFFVLATQNSLEEEISPLPPAQLDRFLFSLPMSLPTLEELDAILERMTDPVPPPSEPVFPGEDLLLMREFARGVAVEPGVRRQVAELIMATHPHADLGRSVGVRKYVRCGASPRAGQALILAAKIRAVRAGRFYIITEDILAFAIAVLRHRVTLTPKAQLDGLVVEDILMNTIQELYHHWER
jgi:MoxR-like ATPase